MRITPELKKELKRIMWDYSVDENTLWAIWEGKSATFSLNRNKLRSRLLLSTSWYRLLDCLGLNGLKEVLTDEVINSIWIKDIREKFIYAQKALHGIVNEVAFRWGELNHFPLFSCVDNETNILSNKISCISRYEVKDIADIWVLAKRLSFSWRDIMSIAGQKSPVDPVEVSKIIKTLPLEELKLIKWAFDVNLDEVYSDLQTIAGDILLGRPNTLKDFQI